MTSVLLENRHYFVNLSSSDTSSVQNYNPQNGQLSQIAPGQLSATQVEQLITTAFLSNLLENSDIDSSIQNAKDFSAAIKRAADLNGILEGLFSLQGAMVDFFLARAEISNVADPRWQQVTEDVLSAVKTLTELYANVGSTATGAFMAAAMTDGAIDDLARVRDRFASEPLDVATFASVWDQYRSAQATLSAAMSIGNGLEYAADSLWDVAKNTFNNLVVAPALAVFDSFLETLGEGLRYAFEWDGFTRLGGLVDTLSSNWVNAVEGIHNIAITFDSISSNNEAAEQFTQTFLGLYDQFADTLPSVDNFGDGKADWVLATFSGLVTTENADDITGTPQDDFMRLGGGADVAYGLAGDDDLRGEAGKDILHGGADNDDLYGGDNDDRLFGEGGNDSLKGEAHDDHLEGGHGEDDLFGDEGNDDLNGGADNDDLDGGAGASDVAIYQRNFAGNYTITDLGGGRYEVTALTTNEGTDTLVRVEYLTFGNTTKTIAAWLEIQSPDPGPDPSPDPDPEPDPTPPSDPPYTPPPDPGLPPEGVSNPLLQVSPVSQSLTFGTSIALSQMFPQARWVDNDGAYDIVGFAVQDRTIGGGYLTYKGRILASGTTHEFLLSEFGDIRFVASGQLGIDQVGFNIIQADGDYSPSLTLGAVVGSVAPTITLPPEEDDPAPDPAEAVAIIDIDNHSDGDVFEEGRSARFTIERRGSLEGDVVLAWRVYGIGSNPADASDFVATSGTFTMRAGRDEQTLNIMLADDSIFEQDERFEIDLNIISGNAEFSDDDEQATILNDDILPPWGSGTDDHGNSLSSSTLVPGESWAQGFIEAPGDVDWFRFDLRGGGSYLIKAYGDNDTSVINGDSSYNAPGLDEAEAILYRSDGSVIARLTEAGGNISWAFARDNYELDLQGQPDQTVYLSVRENGNNDVGQYFVQAQVRIEPDDFSADTLTTATLSLNDPFLASHERTGDSDWFRVELEAGTTYRFMAFDEGRLALPGSALDGSNGHYYFGRNDPRLSIHSSSGAELVATDPDGWPESSNLLQFTAPISGSYFLAVDSVDAFGEMYDYVSLVQEVAEAPTGVPIVLQPGPTEGVDVSFKIRSPGQAGTDDQWLRTNGDDSAALQFDLSRMPLVASYAAIEIFLADTSASSGESADIIVDVPTNSWGEASSLSALGGLDFYTAIPQPSVGEWVTIEITDLYNQWQSGELANNGIVLSDSETSSSPLSRFFSSDYLDDPSLRPKLVIHGPGISATVTGTFAAEMSEDDDSITGAIGITSSFLPDVSFAEAAALGQYGTITVNAAGDTWTYTPFASVQALDAGDTVQDTLTIAASNGLAQQIAITLRGADDPTSFVGTTTVSVTTSAGFGDGGLSLFDIDADDDPVFLARSYEGSRGTLIFDATGDWTYTVDETRLGGLTRGDVVQDTIDVAHSLGSNSFTINLVVDTEINTAPVPDTESFKVIRDGTLVVPAATLLEGDTDADGDELALSGVLNSVNGTVSLDDKGDIDPTNDEVIFTPTPGYSGPARFDYRVIDGFGGEAFSTVSVTVFNRVDGSIGNDTLSGTSGPEEIYGHVGSDVIDGGGGADSLFGNDGFDILIGDGRGLFHIDESAQIFRMYDTIFGRVPDNGGHHGWTLKLLGGTSLNQIAAAFVASPEFQRTYGGVSDTEFVTLLYQNVMNRNPSVTDRDFWVGRLESNWSRTDVVLFFSESTEHVRKTADLLDYYDEHRDITNWGDEVYRIYRAVFDRDPDGVGFNTWTGALVGPMILFTVIQSFVESPEFQNNYGDTTDAEFVTLLYQNVLKRQPDPQGLQGWIDALENGMQRFAVVGFFMVSPEFVTNTRDDMVAWMRDRFPDDILDPGPGDAVVSGGAYADTFVFTNDGQASEVIVTDVEVWDWLDFSDYGLTAPQVLAGMSQDGEDVVFNAGVETVVFKDTQLAAIMEDMILV